MPPRIQCPVCMKCNEPFERGVHVSVGQIPHSKPIGFMCMKCYRVFVEQRQAPRDHTVVLCLTWPDKSLVDILYGKNQDGQYRNP